MLDDGGATEGVVTVKKGEREKGLGTRGDLINFRAKYWVGGGG